ncbi:MAG: hypothetical protein JNJ59_12845 [Deltaproteobacteria bacterium]|nr:hypothetical protein [Deltaproteobacteria bacterium]
MRVSGLAFFGSCAAVFAIGCDDGTAGSFDGRTNSDIPDLVGGDTAPDTVADTEQDTTVPDTEEDTSTPVDTADTSTPADTADTSTPTDTVSPGACPVSDELFMPYCVTCHDQDNNYPDLTPGALKYLINAPAFAYPGKTLVVAGDLAQSFLYTKVHGPGATDGSIMPPVDELPPEAVTALENWIRSGAAACENTVDPGPMTPVKPTPGATIAFTGTPSGFQASRPAWADAGTCTSQQWWKYQGDTESSSMHPGDTCISCHAQNRGPALRYAGTVYPSADEATDCRGVSGVKVELFDDNGTFATTTTNTAGNFYWKTNLVAFKPYRARLTYQGRTREMQIAQKTSGDCNTCHDASGNNGTVGRIVAP